MTTNLVQSISDEVLAEIEKASIHSHCDVPGMVLAGLIARLKAAEADAARYRWLRDKANSMRGDGPQVVITDWAGDIVSIQPWAYPQHENLDKAIDEAMILEK